jgi:nucleoside-diphosphate-sugar epimerase
LRVLVTGSQGFVGRHVMTYLSGHGFEPIGTDVSAGADVVGSIVDTSFVNDKLSRLDFEAIVHLAGIADIKKTMEDPLSCYRVNCFGTLNALELAVKKKLKRFHYACHDARTRVFTTSGVKRYDELQIGDGAFTINPSNGIIEVHPIERIHVYPFDGKMIRFKGRRIDMLVTPNHSMLVGVPARTKGGKVWKTVFETAESVASRSLCRLVSGRWSGMEELPINMHSELSSLEDLFYLTGLFVGDGGLNGKQIQEIKSGLSRSLYLQYRDDSGRFKSSQPNPVKKEFNYPRIFLFIPEKDKARARLEEVLNRSSLKWSGYKKSVYFRSEFLYKLFEQCYDGPPGKHGAQIKKIPRWMLSAGPTLLSAILRGLLDSDGNRGRILSTTSLHLIDDTMELCAKLGYFTSCTPRHTISQIEGRRVESWSFQLYISSKAGTPTLRNKLHNAKPEYYRGNVFCVEVGNHNFLVERNGKIAFSGNSSANVYGAPKKNPVNEEHAMDPRVPYDYSKVVGENFAMSYFKTKGVPVSITRAWLLFGEFDHPSRAVPFFIRKCLKNEPVGLFNSGKDVTAPSHAVNFAKLVAEILEKDAAVGRAFNFGGAEKLSIRELAERVKRLTKSKSELQMLPPRSPAEEEPQVSYPSTERMKKLLSYEYELGLDEGLKRTIEWMRKSG